MTPSERLAIKRDIYRSARKVLGSKEGNISYVIDIIAALDLSKPAGRIAIRSLGAMMWRLAQKKQ